MTQLLHLDPPAADERLIRLLKVLGKREPTRQRRPWWLSRSHLFQRQIKEMVAETRCHTLPSRSRAGCDVLRSFQVRPTVGHPA